MRDDGDMLVLPKDALVITWSRQEGLMMYAPSDFDESGSLDREAEVMIRVYQEMLESGIFDTASGVPGTGTLQ